MLQRYHVSRHLQTIFIGKAKALTYLKTEAMPAFKYCMIQNTFKTISLNKKPSFKVLIHI